MFRNAHTLTGTLYYGASPLYGVFSRKIFQPISIFHKQISDFMETNIRAELAGIDRSQNALVQLHLLITAQANDITHPSEWTIDPLAAP